jgi:PAS domain S-box-containing protein
MTPVEQALAGGIPHRIGWYRFFFADERWEWSPEVEMMHGYEPGTARPTTQVVLGHKHPEDRERVAATLGQILVTHRAFCTRHRIITVAGEIREVLVVSQPIKDEREVVGTQGFYIDVSPGREELITEAVAEITDQRAIIEQVKGVLCVVYRIDADAAFALLRWRSQETNVKLRALAEQLMTDFMCVGGGHQLPEREAFDNLLMTAHLRIARSDDHGGDQDAPG